MEIKVGGMMGGYVISEGIRDAVRNVSAVRAIFVSFWFAVAIYLVVGAGQNGCLWYLCRWNNGHVVDFATVCLGAAVIGVLVKDFEVLEVSAMVGLIIGYHEAIWWTVAFVKDERLALGGIIYTGGVVNFVVFFVLMLVGMPLFLWKSGRLKVRRFAVVVALFVGYCVVWYAIGFPVTLFGGHTALFLSPLANGVEIAGWQLAVWSSVWCYLG